MSLGTAQHKLVHKAERNQVPGFGFFQSKLNKSVSPEFAQDASFIGASHMEALIHRDWRDL